MYCKNIIKAGFIFIAFLLYTALLSAQELKVKNVRFEDKGETVEIKYDLEGEADTKYLVSVMLSYDDGKTLPVNTRYLKGDIGKNIRPGTEKEIIWELKKDYPFGLMGDGFVFGVTAESQKWSIKKMSLYIAGTGIVGGIVYFATRTSKQKEVNAITISIPAEY